MLIDTHCHIDQYKTPDQLVRDCEKNRILAIGVTNLPSHFQIGRQHVSDTDYFKLAIGFHPLAIDPNRYKNELDVFLQQSAKCDFIGEVGLDFSKSSKVSNDIQIDVFKTIICSFDKKKKFITIHSRGAENEVLNILSKYSCCPVVFHWYSGPASLIDSIVSLGHYFSINPSMMKTEKVKTLLSKVPHERILTETDGPYVKIGRRIAMPQDIQSVLDDLATLWAKPRNVVEMMIQHNWEQLSG